MIIIQPMQREDKSINERLFKEMHPSMKYTNPIMQT